MRDSGRGSNSSFSDSPTHSRDEGGDGEDSHSGARTSERKSPSCSKTLSLPSFSGHQRSTSTSSVPPGTGGNWGPSLGGAVSSRNRCESEGIRRPPRLSSHRTADSRLVIYDTYIKALRKFSCGQMKQTVFSQKINFNNNFRYN